MVDDFHNFVSLRLLLLVSLLLILPTCSPNGTLLPEINIGRSLLSGETNEGCMDIFVYYPRATSFHPAIKVMSRDFAWNKTSISLGCPFSKTKQWAAVRIYL
jgi:hypothetical protein